MTYEEIVNMPNKELLKMMEVRLKRYAKEKEEQEKLDKEIAKQRERQSKQRK